MGGEFHFLTFFVFCRKNKNAFPIIFFWRFLIIFVPVSTHRQTLQAHIFCLTFLVYLQYLWNTPPNGKSRWAGALEALPHSLAKKASTTWCSPLHFRFGRTQSPRPSVVTLKDCGKCLQFCWFFGGGWDDRVSDRLTSTFEDFLISWCEKLFQIPGREESKLEQR